MSKLTAILCLVIFASAANASLLSNQLEKAQEDLGKLIESTIASVKTQIENAHKRSQELAAQIEGLAKGYEKKITDDLEAKIQKVAGNIDQFTNSIKGVDVTECSKLVDHLQETAHVAILQVRKCFAEKRSSAAGYVENMMKVADEVLASLHIHKLDARACLDNVDGFISMGKALVCTNLVAAKAGWTAAKAVPAISVEGAKLTFLLTTLPSSVAICTATSALNTFHSEVSGIAGSTMNCVREKLEEVRNKRTTVSEIAPQDPVTDEYSSTSESVPTQNPENTSTPASDESPTNPESPAPMPESDVSI